MDSAETEYTSGRYVQIVRDGKIRDAHRVIWEDAYGPIPDGYDVHHINGDGHDNRLENLVLLTRKEHAQLHGKLRREGCDVVDPNDPIVKAARERHKRYRLAHPEKCKARNAAYRQSHKEEEAARKSKYYQENRDARLAYTAKWREEHAEHVREYTKRHHKVYYAEHVDEIRHRRKENYEKNKEQILEKNRQYAESHRDELRAYRKKYYSERREIVIAQDKLRRAVREGKSESEIRLLEAAVAKAKEDFKSKK